MIPTARLSALVSAALIGVGAAAGACADTTLVYGGSQGNEMKVQMRPGEIRIGGAGDTWQLYKADADTIYAVNPGRKRYTRMDKNTAGAIRERMNALRDRIAARVQRLPKSQRAAARAALFAQMPELDRHKHKIGLDRTGATDTAAGITCDVVQVVRDGKPAQSLCVASADALGIEPATFASVKSMFELLKTMLAGTGFETVGLPYLNLAGMPVRFTQTGTGERRHLVRVSHDELPDSRFRIPQNYAEQRPSPEDR